MHEGKPLTHFFPYTKSFPADPLEHGQTNKSKAVHLPRRVEGVGLLYGGVGSAWALHATLEGFLGPFCPVQMRMGMTAKVNAEA